MADTNQQVLDAVVRIHTEACAGLSLGDELLAIGIAWLSVASNLRNDQMAIPGGFPAERDRQAAWLAKMAEIVRSDTPDIELERLWQEGDVEGAAAHLRRRMAEAEGDA